MPFDHYLAITHWSLEFVSLEARVDKTLVWVSFPVFNLIYYDENLLLAMASVIGKPIKVDSNTLRVERRRLTHICMEIDLTHPIVGKIWLNGHWYKVSYEELHIICTNCGCYGHRIRNCPKPLLAKNASIDASTAPPKMDTSKEKISTSNKEDRKEGDKNEDQPPPTNLQGDWLIVSRKKQTPTGPKNVKLDSNSGAQQQSQQGN